MKHPLLFALCFVLTLVTLPVAAQQLDFPLKVLPVTVDPRTPKSVPATVELPLLGGRFRCIEGQQLVNGTYTTRCLTAGVEILRGKRRHALYTNGIDGQFSPDGTYLALRNVLKKNGKLVEQLRIISIASKKAVSLPLLDCTKYVMRWSQGKLITAAGIQFDVLPDSPYQSQVCAWDTNGKLLGRVEVHGILGNGEGTRPVHRIGFIPNEKLAMYILHSPAYQGNVTGPCKVTAVDLQNASRRASITFDPHAQHYFCTDDQGFDTIDLDLSTFRIDAPTFRFRVIRRNTQDSGSISSIGSWEEVVE